MAYEMMIHLTEDEYNALAVEAKETGLRIEEVIPKLLGKVLAKRILSTKKTWRSPEQQKVSEILYEAGLIDHIPTGEPLSEEEEAELKRLGELFGQAGGKMASEMVIEDRGPY